MYQNVCSEKDSVMCCTDLSSKIEVNIHSSSCWECYWVKSFSHFVQAGISYNNIDGKHKDLTPYP